ncbi:lipocalin family protein [Capnocytophaga genosp. AHN8471]|jgi:hypothetical protein|uniref:lipocalin family protein n=1 Tax=Capnocytophaga genosp. AHN8471 TaxID=327574 RepID=UPI001933D065|nr:lipocalin family protein [Capnocytophaga genosp. AHN8471]MBM0654409.1 lipocalin family protein [Capnocytophaga genosp. AHN8471]
MKKILLIALSVIAFTACTKKDNEDTKHPKELQGTWVYEKSILPDGKLFSEITSSEQIECSKKTKYTFYGEFLTSEEHIFKGGNCQQNTASVKYFVENNKLCLESANGVVLKAYDIVSLTSTQFVFKYNSELKTFLYSQIPYDPALKEKGYTIDDILNVTITYRKL